MRNLMWKDLQQNRNVLLVVGVILGVIYLFPPLLGLAMAPREFSQQANWRNLLDALTGASWIATWVTILFMSPAIVGSLFAGERADRSSQFAGYLPIPRGKAVASRFAVAILCSLAFLLVNGLIGLWCAWLMPTFLGHQAVASHELPFLALMVLSVYLMMFGLACFWSSLLSSPVQAVLAVLGTAAVLATVFLNINNRLPEAETRNHLASVAAYGVAPILGLVSACVGAWICHRRLEL
jgi:ABC-type transport system involved in multi-copper enzyme maturation permease subunit